MKKNKILIGTRASKLAMIYANRAKNEISKVFSGEIELIKITTQGDQNQKDRLLDKNEICKIIKVMSELGVSKIRFTGGEPLLRKDLLDLIQYTYQQTDISSIHLTTNGVLLSKYINQLEKAGLNGINISLDTLNRVKFKKITRREELENVLEGLDLAICSGIKSIKVNMVVMKGFNKDEITDFVELTKNNNITVRFIELMPFDSHQIWKTGKFYSADHILNDLRSHYKTLSPVKGSSTEYYIFKIIFYDLYL